MTTSTATAASITDGASPRPIRWLSSRAVLSDGVSSAFFLLGVIRVLHAYNPPPLASGRARDVPIARRHVGRERRFSRREIDSHSSRYASTFLQKYGHFCEV